MHKAMNGSREINRSEKKLSADKKQPQVAPLLLATAKLAEVPARLTVKATTYLPPMPDGVVGVMHWGLND